jgi:hypothetical protein
MLKTTRILSYYVVDLKARNVERMGCQETRVLQRSKGDRSLSQGNFELGKNSLPGG